MKLASSRIDAALNEVLYRDIIENCADAVVILDAEQTILSVNHSASTMFGHPREFVVGQSLELLIPKALRARHRALVANFKKGDQTSRYMKDRDLEIHGLRADGSEFPVNVSILKSGKGARTSLVAIVRDITEQKQTESELKRLASTDPLTGILNRRTFAYRAEQEFVRAKRYKRPFALAMIDIDNFKRVNDTYGHSVGDQAIVHVVNIITASLRKPDIFGRWGGEEFALLLPETDETSALITTQRLRKKIAETALEQPDAVDIPLMLTVSIGVSGIDPDDDSTSASLDDMINRADKALYLAKRSGRNRACAIRTTTEQPVDNTAA